MAFEDPAEEELDYDNDDAVDAGLPGHPVLEEEEDLDDDDEDYEDLYGDVNVGMYSAPAPPTTGDVPNRNASQNGDLDSVDEDENGAVDVKVDEVAKPVPAPHGDAVDYDKELPDVKEETLYGGQEEVEVGPSKQPKEGASEPAGVNKALVLPKVGKSVGGVNGGGDGGGGARGGWPAGSGPAGGQSVNAAAVVTANNTSNTNSGGFAAFPGKQGADGGSLMLFVGELQWWTTDAELESSLSEYGRVKNLKFFEEKASGKSKGYCQVEFYDSGAARICKEKMDGRVFNGRACVVAFASPQTIKQMGAAQVGKNQANAQGQGQAKKSADGRNGGGGGQGGGGGGEPRGFSKGGGGRGQQIGMERGRGNNSQAAGGRGRGGRGGPPGGGMMPMGGPPGAMMPPRGMMGPGGGGFDPAFGPPGGGYGMGPGGGFGPRGPMIGPLFPPMGPGLPGVPAHVNPAFFGRANGPGPGVEGPPGGWGEVGMPSWEEHQRHMRDGGYAGPEDMGGGGEFPYGGEMGRPGPGRERERGAAGEGEGWGSERRRRDERSGERGGEDWDRGDRHRASDRDGHRERDRGEHREKEKEWERGERTAGRVVPREKDDERTRSREDDHGKRRRMSGDRDRKAER